jgi:hypothetical protein
MKCDWPLLSEYVAPHGAWNAFCTAFYKDIALDGAGSWQGCSQAAAKLPGMRKFSGFLPKAATTLERPWLLGEAVLFQTIRKGAGQESSPS